MHLRFVLPRAATRWHTDRNPHPKARCAGWWRCALILLPLVIVLLGSAVAAADVPGYDLDPRGVGDAHTIIRGPGYNASLTKIIIFSAIFLIWVFAADRITRDAYLMRQNHTLWNPIILGSFFVAFLLMLLIPIFFVGLLLVIIGAVAPIAAYVVVRNKNVEPHERIFTPEHLRYEFAHFANRFGAKVETEKKADYEKGAPVDLKPIGGATERDDTANLILARQSPGFVTLKDFIAKMVRRRADAAMIDVSAEAVATRLQIDGVWHDHEPMDRETGDPLVGVMKTLAGKKAEERRAKQSGKFSAAFEGRKYTCPVVAQGTKTGERAILRLIYQGRPFHSFESLGMREKLRDRMVEVLNTDKGFILISSLPSGGLTTTFDVIMEESDRLMREFVAIEDVAQPEHEIENITVKTYVKSSDETPMTVLPDVVRNYPDVLVVRDLFSAETVKYLCGQVGEGRLIFGSIRARDAAESLLRVLMMKVPADSFAPVATAAIATRLVRRLCPACKVAYEPTAEVRKKLGLPADRVKQLYREPKGEEIEKPCTECFGIGYLGRIGIFELIVIDDKIREILRKQPSVDLVKKAARAAGNKSLQEEGILLVARGETSVPELMRALNEGKKE